MESPLAKLKRCAVRYARLDVLYLSHGEHGLAEALRERESAAQDLREAALEFATGPECEAQEGADKP